VHLRPRSALALAAVALLTVTMACGDDDASSDDPTTTAPADGSSTTEATEPAEGDTVELADTDLGEVLTYEGMTLYVFTNDNGGPSTCNDDCATTWPPFLSEGELSVGDGLDDSLFATATRADGDEQVTVDGSPLYTFSGDSAPGDTNGQGIGGVWFVVGADGQPIDDD
jgi:predicted lipoprotein with Yx(FWY)xxD motif